MDDTLFIFAMGSFILGLVAFALIVTIVEFRKMGDELRRGHGPHLVKSHLARDAKPNTAATRQPAPGRV